MTTPINTTLPIQQRGGLLPVLRYGNFAGEGYAGRLGLETTIQHPDINGGNAISVKELTQTPQGLASFMKVAIQTEPNGYLDTVTRNHDVEYTVAEMRYMNNVQAVFDGKLPHQLTWEEKQTPTFKQLESARNDEYWAADKRMETAVAEYHPEDFVDANYRGLLLNAFYVKAESGLFGYGKGQEVADFYQELKAKDENISSVDIGQAVLTFHRANTLAQANFEELATLPMSPQERQFFNQHLLQPGASLDIFTTNQEEMAIPDGQIDYTHRLVVPVQNGKYFDATVKMGDETITMRLDTTEKDNPVFTKITTVNGEVVSEQVITAFDDKKEGQFSVRAYDVVSHDGQGNLLERSTIAKPPVPKLDTPEDLQAKIDAVKSGNYREVVAEVETNLHSGDAVNGMDLQSDQTNKANQKSSHTKTDDTSDQQVEEGDAASDATQQVTDSFSNPQVPTDKGVQLAGASDVLPDTFADTSRQASANTFINFLNAQGSSLTPAQQDALATQIYNLNLGGEGDLSFYSLPNGGALIANADGDIVGEINQSSTGSLNLKATGIDAEGNTVDVNQHISPDGESLNQGQYNAQVQAQANASVNLFNSLMAAQHWDQLDDVGKLSVLVNVYSAVDTLGGELPGDLGGLASVLSLMQGLESGNGLMVLNSGLQLGQMGLSAYSDYMTDLAIQMADELLTSSAVGAASSAAFDAAAEAALESAAASNAAGQAVPYVSYALALQNFEDHPEQAVGTMLGTYIGTCIGGPIGGAIVGFMGGMVGGMFGGDDDIPMREGLARAQWDESGHTQVVTTQDAEGGGATANSWMASLLNVLQTNLDHHTDVYNQPQYGLVPNLLPSVGFKYDADGFNLANGAKGFMYLQWTDEAGQTQTRYYDGAGDRGDGSGETLVGDFMSHAQGAIAPAWQVQTVLAHYQISGEVDLPTQSSSLPIKLSDGLHQSLQVISLTLPNTLPVEASLSSKLIDVDGDGYLEQTQWLHSNQAILAVDLNVDGQISVGEQVNLQDGLQGDHSRTSMQWLDSNGDNRLTAQDPAFAALKLWVDVNSDGKSASAELQGLAQAGIAAIDFSTYPPCIERADGSQQALTLQALMADTFGVAFGRTAGGVVETTEQQDGSGTSVLHAVNARSFDGQTAHAHGGGQDVDGSNSEVVQVDASQLATTTQNTIANSSKQTSTTVGLGDSRLRSAASPTATVSTTTANNSNNARVVFVPAGQTSAHREIVTVNGSMIASAQSSLFGVRGSSGLSSLGGLGVLTAVSLGATLSAANAAEAAQRPVNLASIGNTFTTTTSSTPYTASTDLDAVSWTQVNLGGAALPTSSSTSTSTTPVAGVGATSVTNTETVFVYATVITSSNSTTPASSVPFVSASTSKPVDVSATASVISLGYPQVQAETLPGTEDVVLRLTQSVLLANDSTINASADPNAPALTITAVSQSLHGQVSLVDGVILFVPETNFHGTASFTYTVTDQYGLSTNSSATLQIAAVNDAPVTLGESVSSDEDIGLIFTQAQLLANDSDVDVATDGQVLRISRVGQAEHGTVWLDPEGNLRFVLDANYHGPAQFTYWVSDGLAAEGAGAETPATVNLTIAAVNDLPVVTGETVNTHEDTTLLFNPASLFANDTDVDVATDGQVLSITAVSNATHCTVAWVTQPDGSQFIEFAPERNYFGVASYQYTVSDGNGGTATTTVVVNLAAVNDAPDVVADTLSATEDTPKTVTQADLLNNDSDVDNPYAELRIVGLSNATHGSVSLNTDGSINFEPELDYFGAATFNYTVGDGVGGFSVGTATVNIVPVNDNPEAVGESLTLNEDEEATFSVASLLTNDTDVDNTHTQLNIQSVGNATHGSVSLVTTNGKTSVVFTPDLNFNGTASFTYTVSDGAGGSATTSMSLDFTPVNDLPVVNNELFMGKRNVSYSLGTAALLANDSDVETAHANLTITRVGNAQHGTVSLENDNVEFVPEAGYAGRGSFDYVVQDADGGQRTATAQIDFSRINVNPVAVDDSFGGFEDVPFIITQTELLINDSDSDNANSSLRVVNLGSANHGTVNFDAQGNVVFKPDANFYGQASFTYQVSDGDGGSTWATASLSVASVNDAPIIEDVWYGRPIYGYMWAASVDTDEYGGYVNHTWGLAPVTSESVARALLLNPNDVVFAEGLPSGATDLSRSNDLMTSTGAVLSFNDYLNGHLKPIAFDSVDAMGQSESGISPYPYVLTPDDDDYRQNGTVIAFDPDGDSSTLTFSIGSTPTHGHAWINQYTSLNAEGNLDHTQVEAYWIPETGAWQYFSSRGDTYTGGDGFKVSVTDGEGASTSITINATHTGSSPAGGGGKKPVTLDLNGDGLQYIGIDDSKAYFDVNDDGWRERMAWVGGGDGLLALDTQGDHTIDKWNEISFVSYREGAQTDLEGLQAFDSSDNGQLDHLDARWHEFGAWVDANANGACETGEFKTLDELGIVRINLSSDHNVLTPVHGVTELGQSSFMTVEGKTHAVGDVIFEVDVTQTLPQMTNVDMQLAGVIRQALLFNQMVNTANTSIEPSLSFVSNELMTQDWVQPELHALVDVQVFAGVRPS